MLAGNAVVAAKMAFGLVPEVFDAVDVVLPVSKEPGVIDPHVVEIGDVELVIGAEAVGVDDAVRLDFTGDYRDQRIGLGVFHRQDEDMAAAFQQPEHRDLACRAAAALSLAHPAEIAFVDFDLASQFARFSRQIFGDDGAQPVIKGRRSVLVHPDQSSRRSSRRPRHKVFYQPVGLIMCEP
mgnify:CR=1 FL=1